MVELLMKLLQEINVFQHENKPYCDQCYSALFGPKGGPTSFTVKSRVLLTILQDMVTAAPKVTRFIHSSVPRGRDIRHCHLSKK
uniref:Uncharacterized protein n=1 Tax=Romanomermis culicivorax TaxID=13658 RepID=A0A915I164_ROMCU